MAFKDKTAKYQYKKLTELAVGGTMEGYLVGIEDGNHEGSKNLVMRIDGEDYRVSAIGNIKFTVQDNKLVLGQLTQITRNEDRKGKKGTKPSTNFTVLQDDESVIAVATATPYVNGAATDAGGGSSVAARIVALKSGAGSIAGSN